MNTEQIGQVLHAQPFKAFRLYLADGRNLDVDHPDFVARAPSGRTIVVYRQDDTFEIVDLLLVTSIEVRNGK